MTRPDHFSDAQGDARREALRESNRESDQASMRAMQMVISVLGFAAAVAIGAVIADWMTGEECIGAAVRQWHKANP